MTVDMSLPSLSSLSPELQLAVFRSLDTFADVSALMRTSQLFHAIWKVHMRYICSALLPRAIDCLGDAQDLLDIQERLTPNWQQAATHDIRRIKRLLSTQRIAYESGRRFEADYKKWSGKSGRRFSLVNPVDRIRFMQCYYRFWAFFEMFPSSNSVDKSLYMPLRYTGQSQDLHWLLTHAWKVRMVRFGLVKDLKHWPDVDVFIDDMGHLFRLVQLSSDETKLYYEIVDFLG